MALEAPLFTYCCIRLQPPLTTISQPRVLVASKGWHVAITANMCVN
jgi:hypothetical protein